MVAFLLALLTLGAIALVAALTPARIITGLPPGPEFAAVRASVNGRLQVEGGELRFESALMGEGGVPDVALAIRAARELRAARMPWPGDPRHLAALAALDLAAHQHASAERLDRRALGLAPTYGEARLGLGVTLALRAAAEGDGEKARGLRLQAIAQFAAVAERDPLFAPALYDRALLLARVGRTDEARRWAGVYLARDPASPLKAVSMVATSMSGTSVNVLRTGSINHP